MKPNQTYSINISLYSLFKTLLIIGGIWMAFTLRDIIVLVILAFIISSGIILGGRTLSKAINIPYQLGVLLVLALLAGIGSILMGLIIPTISSEFTTLINNLPRLRQDINVFIGNLINVEDFNVTQYIGIGNNTNIGQFTWDIITGVFFTTNNIFNTLILIGFFGITTFYMAIQPQSFDQILQFFTRDKQTKKHIADTIERARNKVGYWLAGQMIISFILAIVTYIALALLGVPYALLLALIAAFFNLIPIIGPILSAVPAIFLALIIDFRLAVVTGLLYLVIQQVDGNFMTPLIMKKVTGLHSLVVMITILLGTALAGALGALIAVPVVSIISLFVKELEEK